jgi:hypothetical protein
MKESDTYYGKKYDVETVKQIKSLIKTIKEYGFDEVDKIKKKHPKIKFNDSGVGSGAYIGKKFVVKDPYLCGSEPPKKYKCPTTVLKNGLMVQPRCKVFVSLSDKMKRKFLKAGLVAIDSFGYYTLAKGGDDAHEENFGLLNGNLKQFDW